jgi:hypothetical protein
MGPSEQQLLSGLQTAAQHHQEWATLGILENESPVAIHLAVMVEPFLTHILSGEKTIESRFSRRAIAPFERAAIGDLVLLKAGPVVGSFRVSSTNFITLHDSNDLMQVRAAYGRAICAEDDDFWNARSGKRYATLLGVADVRKLPPTHIPKSDRRGWVVLQSRRQTPGEGTTNRQPAPRAPESAQLSLNLPASATCANGHLFRPPSVEPPGACLHCGLHVVDWERLHQRQESDWRYTFSCLQSEQLRNAFWRGEIDETARQRYERQQARIEEFAAKRLRQSVSRVYGSDPDARPYRDGYQTPTKGDILFYAQHALACCCRRCMRYWHAVPYGRNLYDAEIDYFSALISHYARVRLEDDL